MKTILVTGGTGLVGSAIRQVISEELTDVEIIKDYRCIFLSSKDGNLIIREDVKRIFEIYKPTYVIHLAASVGGLYKNLNNNLKMYLDNLKINQNIEDGRNWYIYHAWNRYRFNLCFIVFIFG